MTTPLTFPDNDKRTGGLARRTLLKGAAAMAATGATVTAASAATVTPFGETGVPLRPSPRAMSSR